MGYDGDDDAANRMTHPGVWILPLTRAHIPEVVATDKTASIQRRQRWLCVCATSAATSSSSTSAASLHLVESAPSSAPYITAANHNHNTIYMDSDRRAWHQRIVRLFTTFYARIFFAMRTQPDSRIFAGAIVWMGRTMLDILLHANSIEQIRSYSCSYRNERMDNSIHNNGMFAQFERSDEDPLHIFALSLVVEPHIMSLYIENANAKYPTQNYGSRRRKKIDRRSIDVRFERIGNVEAKK